MTTPDLAPHVIYPYGALLDLLPVRGDYRVYGLEFTGGNVKVGRSKNCADRIRTLAKCAEMVGLKPLRFFVSPYYNNAGRVELAVIEAMRKEFELSTLLEQSPAASEWFAGCSLSRPLELLSEWMPWRDQYGHQIAMRVSDIEDKLTAEAAAGVA